MRLINYLNENSIIDEIRKILKTRCKKYLNEFLPNFNGMYYMWSGRDGISKPYTIKKVRKDRKPMNTPLKIHNKIDDMFEDEFGYRPRSNSIFVTGNKNMTDLYGDPFMVFPLMNYKYLWNPNIKDFYMSVNFEKTNDEQLKNIVKNYKNDELYRGLRSGVEIMLTCDEYLLISDELKEEVDIILKNW